MITLVLIVSVANLCCSLSLAGKGTRHSRTHVRTVKDMSNDTRRHIEVLDQEKAV